MHYKHSEYFSAIRVPERALDHDESVKGYYKLIDAQDSAIRMYLPHEESGKAVYNHHSLYPNTKYNKYLTDRLFMDAITKAKTEVRHTPSRQETLDACGVEYEIKVCKACGGKVQKLVYCPVEVIYESD